MPSLHLGLLFPVLQDIYYNIMYLHNTENAAYYMDLNSHLRMDVNMYQDVVVYEVLVDYHIVDLVDCWAIDVHVVRFEEDMDMVGLGHGFVNN